MTTLMQSYEEIITVFCAYDMKNNIQYGVISLYPSMSGRAMPRALSGW